MKFQSEVTNFLISSKRFQTPSFRRAGPNVCSKPLRNSHWPTNGEVITEQISEKKRKRIKGQAFPSLISLAKFGKFTLIISRLSRRRVGKHSGKPSQNWETMAVAFRCTFFIGVEALALILIFYILRLFSSLGSRKNLLIRDYPLGN